MAEANRTPCTSLPNTATKKELRLSHRQKMDKKKAEGQLHAGRKTREYSVTANLSKGHKDSGRHPTEAYG